MLETLLTTNLELNSNINYFAVHENGLVFFSEHKPFIDEIQKKWRSPQDFDGFSTTLFVGDPNIDWRKTLHVKVNKTFLPLPHKNSLIYVATSEDAQYIKAHATGIYDKKLGVGAYLNGKTSWTVSPEEAAYFPFWKPA